MFGFSPTNDLAVWINDGFASLNVMIPLLLARTGIGNVVLVMVGVAMIGHLFRIIFGHGGVSEGAQALGDTFRDNGDGGWAVLEQNAEKVAAAELKAERAKDYIKVGQHPVRRRR